MRKSIKQKTGFTLIELLVVISIIGILAALGTARYSTIEKQTRDAQRKSDLNQYRVALENYSAVNSLAYPKLASTCADITSLCNYSSTTFQNTYLAGSCLEDSKLATNGDYRYCSDGANYLLRAKLEIKIDDFPTYFYVCSNGKSQVKSYRPGQTPAGEDSVDCQLQ